MMEESNHQEFQEKVLTLLHQQYCEGLGLLKNREFQKGCDVLLGILQHPLTKDCDLDGLRFSTFMSLAEVQESMGDSRASLGFYWQALQILQRRWELTQKDQPGSKQEDDRPEEFTLILKMVLILEKLNIPDELINLLKKGIKLSPVLWRQKLILKLKDCYERERKFECLKDLTYLIDNRDKMEQVLAQKTIHEVKDQKAEEFLSELNQSESSIKCIEKVTITVSLGQKDETGLNYSSWETLLTMSYVLLKCQSSRNFNRKKYMHRKYDDNNKDWCRLVREFSLTGTRIEVVLIEKEEEEEKMEVEGEQEPNWGKMVSEVANELLKFKYMRKKAKKQLNPLEELTRVPSLNSKDSKKVITAQTKSIFTCLGEYYKEMISKSHFKKESLNNLKTFGEAAFQEIFGEIMKNEADQQIKGDNQEDENECSFSMPDALNSGQKDPLKEKKSLKVKRLEMVAFQREISSFLPLILGDGQQKIVFGNIIEMIEEVTTRLMDLSQEADKKTAVLNISGIRRTLEKNILKVIQKGEGFFQDQHSTRFLDILMEKLDHLVDKTPKAKDFAQHQEDKKKILMDFIKLRFLPSTYAIQKALASELEVPELRLLSHICYSLVRMNSLHGMTNLPEIAFYRDLFIIFKVREERGASKGEVERKVTNFIDREVEKHQKKINLRMSLMTIKDEKEENSNSVEEIYKKDPEISVVLPLLRAFNCHPEGKLKGPSEMSVELNGRIYLLTFIKLSELFFKKIQIESTREFNSRLLTLLGDIMKIKQIIGELYTKFMDNLTFKSTGVSPSVYYQALLYLIRFYMLNLPQDNDNSLKIAFIISNILLKEKSEESKYLLVPKFICMFDELIKYKKGRTEIVASIRKRFYLNLILKNLNYIYNSPLHALVPGKDEKAMVEEEGEAIRDRVFDILHDIYFCPDKDKEFTPKRIEEAVGYFMYLLRAYHEMFENKVIELENEALKVFKKCYRLYIDKKDDILKMCQHFKGFASTFQAVVNGEASTADTESFLSIIRMERPICECCPNLRKTHGFCIETLFVLGKFFEAQFVQQELSPSKQTWLEQIDQDENYYFQYLTLNLNKESAWQNIIRVNCTKTFFYFDSILNKPFDHFKGKFNFTKKLILFGMENLPESRRLASYGLANLQILNILKIKERQYLMIQKEIELNGVNNRQMRELNRKYSEGMKKIAYSTKSQPKDVKVRYLRWSQLKCKLFWINLTRTVKQDKVQPEAIVIELDGEPDKEEEKAKKVHPPSKFIGELTELIDQARQMLEDLSFQANDDHLLHLKEDVIMEMYVLLGKTIQHTFQKMLGCICSSISTLASKTIRKTHQVELISSDLDHLVKIFRSGSFLTSNSRYELLEANMAISAADLSKLKTLFVNLFTGKSAQQQVNEVKQQKIVEDKGPAVVVVEEQNEGDVEMKEKVAEQDPLVGKQEKRSSSQSEQKEEGKQAKDVAMDLGKYICSRIVEYINVNRLFQIPLNTIQRTLYSPLFQELLLKLSKILNEVVRVIIDLPKYQVKKFKNRRSVVLSMLYCCHLTITFSKTPNRANELIKDFYTFKADEFATINLYNDKIWAQKNDLLADFYSRLIVHQIMKVQFIRGVFVVFRVTGNKEYLMLLVKKLLKLSKISDSKTEKEKEKTVKPQGKEGSNMEVMEEEGKKKEVVDLNLPQEGKEVKETNAGKEKDNCSKELESTMYFNLFCEGALNLVDILIKESFDKEVEEKYEKATLEFKNKIKRRAGEEKNSYFDKIEEFLNAYQIRFNKKIRIKKTKKDRELYNALLLNKNGESFMGVENPVFQKVPIVLPDLPIPKKVEVKPEKPKKMEQPEQMSVFGLPTQYLMKQGKSDNTMLGTLLSKVQQEARANSWKAEKKEVSALPGIVEGNRSKPIEIEQSSIERREQESSDQAEERRGKPQETINPKAVPTINPKAVPTIKKEKVDKSWKTPSKKTEKKGQSLDRG